jgi:hypothetical protein
MMFLDKVFNATIGKSVRGYRRIIPTIPKPPPGVLELIEENARLESYEYAKNFFTTAMLFDEKSALWRYCLDRINLQMKYNSNSNPIIAEFGVWQGASINFFAKYLPQAKIYGFDSFLGLEEDWVGYKRVKGAYSTRGKLPKVAANVVLNVGWFEDTMAEFLQLLGQDQIMLLHLDSDTYKPTSFVLEQLIKNIKAGTIIIFDEYFGYPGWQLHEHKAWTEIVNRYGLKFKCIGFTDIRVAFELL